MKLTTIAQVQTVIGRHNPVERIKGNFYQIPGYPTPTMNRKQLLAWANEVLEVPPTVVAKVKYTRKAAARSKTQAIYLTKILG
jgi:hypothetical protein